MALATAVKLVTGINDHLIELGTTEGLRTVTNLSADSTTQNGHKTLYVMDERAVKMLEEIYMLLKTYMERNL